MAIIYPALACNLDTNILRASLPLLEAEQVEAIEWSFDTMATHPLPAWFDQLLRTYGDADRLIGHGVFFSLFSGRWTTDQQAWLRHLKAIATDFNFDHLTEHFGFMTGTDFHTGAPLGVPLTPSTLAIGQDRLKRIQDAARCPVGLENLALACSPDEVSRQGDFLFRLLEPINGFLILDLHNLYCQSHNFGVAYETLLAGYPLERVREIHVSGGSWAFTNQDPQRRVRRDTHDEAVPGELFGWLATVIDRCPNLKYVVLEQLGSGLLTEQARTDFASDFRQLADVVHRHNQPSDVHSLNDFLPTTSVHYPLQPLEDTALFEQQRQLVHILETASNPDQAQQLLAASGLSATAWEVEKWQPAMLETAMAITKKWRNGFP